MARDTYAQLVSDMDDRISELEKGLTYCATMLKLAVPEIAHKPNQTILADVAEKSLALAKKRSPKKAKDTPND